MKIGDIVVNIRTGKYSVIIEHVYPNKYREALVKVFPEHPNKWIAARCYEVINESR